MATAAPKPCGHPGCGVLVRDGTSRCEKHKQTYKKNFERYRGSARKRGYTWEWEKARKAYLSEAEHALCVRCFEEGRIEPATVVDHIEPHRGNMSLFWNRSNWQPLCKRCHDKKTATEDVAFGRVDVVKWEESQ